MVLMILTAAYLLGAAAGIAAEKLALDKQTDAASAAVTASSAEGNWGLSFQEEGKTPAGNATPFWPATVSSAMKNLIQRPLMPANSWAPHWPASFKTFQNTAGSNSLLKSNNRNQNLSSKNNKNIIFIHPLRQLYASGISAVGSFLPFRSDEVFYSYDVKPPQNSSVPMRQIYHTLAFGSSSIFVIFSSAMMSQYTPFLHRCLPYFFPERSDSLT